MRRAHGGGQGGQGRRAQVVAPSAAALCGAVAVDRRLPPRGCLAWFARARGRSGSRSRLSLVQVPAAAQTGGTTIVGYPEFPDSRYSDGTLPSFRVPKAEVWVFTTPLNPENASLPLVPLYRFSWKCGDWAPYQPAICSTNSQHTDSTYSADPVNGISFFESLGYKLDGIEGYIYPMSMTQPPGTVRLMRKYNPQPRAG